MYHIALLQMCICLFAGCGLTVGVLVVGLIAFKQVCAWYGELTVWLHLAKLLTQPPII